MVVVARMRSLLLNTVIRGVIVAVVCLALCLGSRFDHVTSRPAQPRHSARSLPA